jgi:hypothetical protein
MGISGKEFIMKYEIKNNNTKKKIITTTSSESTQNSAK